MVGLLCDAVEEEELAERPCVLLLADISLNVPCSVEFFLFFVSRTLLLHVVTEFNFFFFFHRCYTVLSIVIVEDRVDCWLIIYYKQQPSILTHSLYSLSDTNCIVPPTYLRTFNSCRTYQQKKHQTYDISTFKKKIKRINIKILIIYIYYI